MKKKYLLVICLLVFVFFTRRSCQATSFFNSEQLMEDEDVAGAYWTIDPWIKFGGCEDNSQLSCVGHWHENTQPYFIIGDFNTKQGVYQLSVPNDQHVHGKLVLKLSYRFETEEEKSSLSTDAGIIKLKDVETNKNYYYKEITPADGSMEDWSALRFNLPIEAVNRQLQLVFETVNDGEKLSTLAVDDVVLIHKSEPEIYGNLTYKKAGKYFTAAGVTVKLMNRKKTKTYKTTVTDGNGYFSFWPIEKTNKKYTLVATLDNYEGYQDVKKSSYYKNGKFKKKLKYGYRYENSFYIN